jgi:hypothetical protein
MICAVISNSPLSDSAHAIVAQQSHGSRKCRLTGGNGGQIKRGRQFLAGGFGASLKLLDETMARSFLPVGGLAQVGLDRGEDGNQSRTNGLHDDNDRNADAGGDEAIFDGGHARFILQETRELRHNFNTPWILNVDSTCTCPAFALQTMPR